MQANEAQFEKLRVHAEEKLAEARKRINQQRSDYYREIQTLTAKLAKLEEGNASLEQQLQAKLQENKELQVIFEEGLKKLDWTVKASKSTLNASLGPGMQFKDVGVKPAPTQSNVNE